MIYDSVDEKVGKKLTLYLDEQARPVPMPRVFEKLNEPAPAGSRQGKKIQAR